METVEVKKMTYGVDSLAHLENGKVVFVPYGSPGDTLDIEITEEKNDYCRGEIKKVKNASPERRKSPCPNFPECGGCHWLHLYPETQLREKEENLAFILRPLNPGKIYPMEPLAMTGYRNKMDLKIAVNEKGKFVLGNYRYRSHDVVSLKGCIVQCPENMEIFTTLEKFVNLKKHKELAENISNIVARTLKPQQHVTFLLKEAPDEKQLSFLQDYFDKNEVITRLEVNSPVGNHLTLMRNTEPFNFMKRNWRISAGSFFQNNLEGAEAILHTLSSIYNGFQHKGKFIDLYCGCGIQTFLLEGLFDETYGIESNQSSIQDAIYYQRARSSSKAKFLCRKVESIFNTQVTKGIIAAVHLNPPRTGLSQRASRGLSGIKPKIITYLSCNPMTFRRDAKFIKSLGYKLQRVHSFDLFPGTFHMETLGLFVRG